jgi:hypothetical protein
MTAAVGVEVEDPVDDDREQVDIVGDDDQPTRVALEVVAKPDDRVGVEVVGRLVEQQRLAPENRMRARVRSGGAGRRRGCRSPGRVAAR